MSLFALIRSDYRRFVALGATHSLKDDPILPGLVGRFRLSRFPLSVLSDSFQPFAETGTLALPDRT